MAAAVEAIVQDMDRALAYTQGAGGALLSALAGRSAGQCPFGKPRRVHKTGSDPRRTSVQLPGAVESPDLGCQPVQRYDLRLGIPAVRFRHRRDQEAPIERQTELVLEQVKLCPETAGSSMEHVLKC